MLFFNSLYHTTKQPQSGLKGITINDLEQLTGIKSHTLRIWEKRYNLIQPGRQSNNFRKYTSEDLEKILNISLLNKSGYRISTLSAMKEFDIANTINKLTDEKDKKERAINALVLCMYQMKTDEFEMILNVCCLTWSIDILIRDIIYTFLQRTNLLWQGNRFTEEHFIVTAIRKKLIIGIEKAEVLWQKDKKALLFLPDNKQLDLMLLYTNYILKKNGWQVYYMGTDVSIENLKSVLQMKKPSVLFTYLPQKHHFDLVQLSEFMQANLPESRLFIAAHSDPFGAREINGNIIFTDHENALHSMREYRKV